MIRIELINYIKNIEPYYLVHKLNEEGFIIASLLVKIEDGITEEYLLGQAKEIGSNIYNGLQLLIEGVIETES